MDDCDGWISVRELHGHEVFGPDAGGEVDGAGSEKYGYGAGADGAATVGGVERRSANERAAVR